jgi:SAM-dependent methyltransferase
MTNPWTRPEVAQQQRALVDLQLAEKPWPIHFSALVEAIRATNCPGEILEVGCASGYGREILDRAGVEYKSYAGLDISPAAILLAKERYPESTWVSGEFPVWQPAARVDVVVDGCALMHVDAWRAHLTALCAASRRWVVLHRVPVGDDETQRCQTSGYGQTFPAWFFDREDVIATMEASGFKLVSSINADGESKTLTFAKPRHWVSYCDSAYLPRLKALYASMVRHCGPFDLHVLAWDDGVADWCAANNVESESIDGFLGERKDLQIENLPGPRRTRVEHMWTVGPAWINRTMNETGKPVTYVDADVMFFSSPEPVFAEIGGARAALVPHGFAEASRGLPGPTRQTHEVFGRFNVGIVYIARRVSADVWAEECRCWCYDRLEQAPHDPPPVDLPFDGILYGDQKYFDAWPGIGAAHVVQHPGACAGPWQIHTRALDVRDGVIHFGNRPLVSYHFSGYREGPHGQEQLTRPEYALNERQAELIYTPYVRALKEAGR